MVAGGVRFGPGGLLAGGGFSSVLEGGVGAGSKSQAQGWGGGRFQAEGRPVCRPEVIEGGEGGGVGLGCRVEVGWEGLSSAGQQVDRARGQPGGRHLPGDLPQDMGVCFVLNIIQENIYFA